MLLDVRDTDKLGIYSMSWFFSLLVSPKVNLLPANRSALLKHSVERARESFKRSAKKFSKTLEPEGHLKDQTALSVFVFVVWPGKRLCLV